MVIDPGVPEGRGFGQLADGCAARLFTIGGPDGPIARVTDFGATLVELHLPDRDGNLEDVVLGFDGVDGYQSPDNMYFGATVGRVANRIAGASFTIGGRRYDLAANQAPNHLHGGPTRGLSRVLWEVVAADARQIDLRYVSPDGEEGYPGRLEVRARYRLEGGRLELDHEATTDAVTPVNLTNHTYWNLGGAGNGTILDHDLQVSASHYTPVDDTLIPTGEIAPVDGTPFDLRRPTPIAQRLGELEATPAGGYDHNLVIDGTPGELRPAARLHDPSTGRFVELHTDQPGVQFYSGHKLRGQMGKRDAIYPRHGALCLEPQHHPDAVNQPGFPSVLLEPGEVYRHTSTFVLGVD